jgi:uncharacterized protein (DUF488 family)
MMEQIAEGLPVILTIGHSTRTLEDFISLLQAHAAMRVVDVRTIPWSRRNPQFNHDTLPDALGNEGIDYIHLPGLGGRRRHRPDSPNAGWQNVSFRGYADHMQTAEFEKDLQRLMALAQLQRLALMCAEAVPWRCHRSLIADALVVREYQVEHILSRTRRQAHVLTPWAKVHGTRLTYPPPLDFEHNE